MKTLLATLSLVFLAACGNANQGSTTKDAGDAPTADDSAEAANSAPNMSCTSTDGAYSIKVAHNGAKIYDANDALVGSYGNLKKVQSSFSVSFGHVNYVDPATGGQEITIAMPSTNTPFAITATLDDGTSISYHAARIGETATLTCAN